MARNQFEHQAQAALFERVAYWRDTYPVLNSVFAVPNGEFRGERAGARLKAEGVQAGVWDVKVDVSRVDDVEWDVAFDAMGGCFRHLCFPFWDSSGAEHVTPGFWIELKAPGKCRGINYGLSAEQQAFATTAADAGNRLLATDDWVVAWEEMKEYLGLPIKETIH